MDINRFIREVHNLIDDKLDERSRRLLMAAEATAIGRGGITLVATANKASRVNDYTWDTRVVQEKRIKY